MMPPRITARSRLANASPSVALEKGSYYRTRASHKRSGSTLQPPNPYIQRHTQPKTRQNTKLATLLILLAFACITCFGLAYYLFKTRWETPVQHPHALSTNSPFPQVSVSTSDDFQEEAYINPEERFLAYLPHSGFHNQRIALENALVLARLLNRTLIVPPARLGNKPIPYYPFDRLSRALASSDKMGLQYCIEVPFWLATPIECLDYFEYTSISWDWLVNLTSVRARQKIRYRWNFDEGWFKDTLNISDNQAFVLRERAIYQYRVVDDVSKISKGRSHHMEDVSISDLARVKQKLLFFGTLFGSSRLRFQERYYLDVRREIRETMAITHPALIQISESIFKALGSRYLAIHLRAGDSKFKDVSDLSSRRIWWVLVHRILNRTMSDTLLLEQIIHGSELPLNISSLGLLPLPGQYLPLNIEERSLLESLWLPCRKSRSRVSIFDAIGLSTAPLYVATDLKNPHRNPLLARFQRTFPCIFYLSDFASQLAPLDQLVNQMDGVPLRPHLSSFVDAMVAARALRVVGTKGSTFSHYIEDVLWKRFHNLPIKQRG